MKLKIILERLGLPKHSHTVYQAVEKHGPLLVSHIIEKVPAHRPSAYRAIRALKKHHFIFCTQSGKRQLYHAASRELIAQEFSKTSKEVVAEMAKRSVEKEAYLQKEIIFLEGAQGVRMLPKDYRTLRDAKKLERLVISNPVSGKQKRSRLERFIKFIPPNFDLFQQNIIQLIYGDRLSLIDLNTNRVVIIESKALAEFQKIIFQQLYRNLPG